MFRLTGEIANDRDLLLALGLTDAETSIYVEKSRQTLINKLRAAKEGKAPDNYFKASEILMLVTAAAKTQTEFTSKRKEAVFNYIRESRGGSENEQDRMLLKVVLDTLSGEPDLDLTAAATIVFLLPDFLALKSSQPNAFSLLRSVVRDAQGMDLSPKLLVLSAGKLEAGAAAAELGLSANDQNFGYDERAAQHMSSVNIITKYGDCQTYIISADGSLFFTPAYTGPKTLHLLDQMLEGKLKSNPNDRSSDLNSLDAATGTHK